MTPDEKANARPRDFGNMNIDAILVFSDSRDYGTDLQIIMDLLRSEDGRLGTKAKDPLAQRIPIYFSQGDLLCPTEHPIPRMSQGTFRIALEAMYKSITGVELDRIVYGKPGTCFLTPLYGVVTNSSQNPQLTCILRRSWHLGWGRFIMKRGFQTMCSW